jgi:hypothetical protein
MMPMFRRRRAQAALCLIALLLEAEAALPQDLPVSDSLNAVALHVIPRELLFFSAVTGRWTSVRLDPGEHILQRGAHGSVAAVVTSQRAIGFSATLDSTHEISVSVEEGVDNFKLEGYSATFLTRRRAFGFSAITGRWVEIPRFQLGR